MESDVTKPIEADDKISSASKADGVIMALWVGMLPVQDGRSNDSVLSIHGLCSD